MQIHSFVGVDMYVCVCAKVSHSAAECWDKDCCFIEYFIFFLYCRQTTHWSLYLLRGISAITS